MSANLTPYVPGMDYGTGINSLNGSVRGDGVTRPTPEAVGGASGQTIQFALSKIESAFRGAGRIQKQRYGHGWSDVQSL